MSEANCQSAARTCASESLIPLFALRLPPLNFWRLQPTFYLPSLLAQAVAYSMLKHLLRSDIDLLFHIFPGLCILFLPSFILKFSSIISMHDMIKPHDSHASFWPISLALCVSKLFERIILSYLLFFLRSLRQVGFRPDDFLRIKFLIFLRPLRLDVTSPNCGSANPFHMTSLKQLTQSRIPFSFTKLFQVTFLHTLFNGLNIFFGRGTPAWFFKITKVAPFESVKVLLMDPFLALLFSLSSTIISLRLYLRPSAALFMLTNWPSDPAFPRSCCCRGHTEALI